MTSSDAGMYETEYEPTQAQKRILFHLCEENRLVEWQDGIFIEPLGIAANREDVDALVRHGFVHAPGSLPIARGSDGPLELTDDAAAELAADEEAEIIAEIQAEEELWSEWNAPPGPTDEDDEELDALFWDAMEKDD